MMTAQIGQAPAPVSMDWLAMYNRSQFRDRMRKTSKNSSKALKDATNTVNNRPSRPQNMHILQPHKKQRLSPQKKAQRHFITYNDENNNVNANMTGVVKPADNILSVKKNTYQPSLPVAVPILAGEEYRIVKSAAQSLLNLSFANGFNTPFPWNKVAHITPTAPAKTKIAKKPPQYAPKLVENIDKESTETSEPEDENNFLDTEEYRRRAQELLFQTSDILLGERKDAFFELVKRLCPYITIQRSGSRTLRTYLVDTRKKKRYRTYSDAIKGGALDPLLIETGTTVLLRGCVEEAKKRFHLLLEEQRQQQSICQVRVQTA